MAATSTTATHTPGEWEIADSDNRFVYALDAESGCNRFDLTVHCYQQYALPGEAAANARLIAAAPDLLEACKELLRAVDDVYTATGYFKLSDTSEQRLKIEAAIAKATNP